MNDQRDDTNLRAVHRECERIAGNSLAHGSRSPSATPKLRGKAPPSPQATGPRRAQPRELERAPVGSVSVKVVAISVPFAELDAIDQAAQRAGKTRSGFLRMLARAWIADNPP
jgi:hypothetical protein